MNTKRREMGEEKWAEYQRLRKNEKADRYKKRNVEKVIESRRRKKRALIEYKGGKCHRCGYDKDVPSAYDFHHVDPLKKSFNISHKNWSIQRCKEECDKCILLCCRCHAEVHHEMVMNRLTSP